MEKHNISVLISEEEVQKRVRELAAQISNCLLYTSDAADD